MKTTLDTSYIMGNVEILGEILVASDIYIPYVVLSELDRLKDNGELKKSKRAQRAINIIEYYYDSINFIRNEVMECADDAIIDVAINYGTRLLTNDICMKVKAKNLGIEVNNVNRDIGDDYKGYTIKIIGDDTYEDSKLLADLYNDRSKNVFDLNTNEYLIIKDENSPIYDDNKVNIKGYKTLDILVWDGENHNKLKHIPSRTGIKAKNDMQRCAIDLLLNDNIPVKGIFGNAGCGKTFLATKLALYHLKEKETYKSIMMVRNPVGPGENIGFLKGDKDSKIGDFFKPIIQHLDNGEIEANALISQGKLYKEIPKFMKGLDIQDTYILVDEAEDLSKKLVKLLGTRVGEGSAIVFTGDYSQSEGKFKNNSGVKNLIQKAKGSSIFGCVVLDEDIRSDTSKLFAEIF